MKHIKEGDSKDGLLTTVELAEKFKVKTTTVHHNKWLKGHFRGYEPHAYAEGGAYLWRFVGE